MPTKRKAFVILFSGVGGVELRLSLLRGVLALRPVNYLHSPYPTSNADYLYVLGLFIFEPYRLIERVGWRRWTQMEKEAHFN